MIKGEYLKLLDLAKWNVCAEHKTPLVVAWHATADSYVLRCGENHYPEAITRQRSLSELARQGEELPEPIKSNIEKRGARKRMENKNSPNAETFAGVPAVDLATGELLSLEILQRLIAWAHDRGLEPTSNHVVIMYGNPYVTIDGYLYHARKSRIHYSLESNPLSEAARKPYKLGEHTHIWLSVCRLIDTGETYSGLGIVTEDEMTATSKRDSTRLRSPVVAAHPWQLAQKRAEWQALRRAFPIGGVESKEESTNAEDSQK